MLGMVVVVGVGMRVSVILRVLGMAATRKGMMDLFRNRKARLQRPAFPALRARRELMVSTTLAMPVARSHVLSVGARYSPLVV